MSDSRPAYDEQLPWLEAVDDEDGPSGIPAKRMLAALLVVLLAAALVSTTFFWLGRQKAGEVAGAPELIRADPNPYKIKPTDPGGLDVAGESETAFQTSAGEDTDAQLDLSRMPEQAVAPPPKPAAEPKPTETPKPQSAEAAPEQSTGGKGSVIQLGAFANRAQAERAWSALSARFPSVAAMNKLVIPFSGGIRLRAAATSPAEARQACQALKVAGENCFVAN
jgi:type IV secretory pathway VirB10-like protein